MAELERPDVSARVMNECWLHWHRQQERETHTRDEVFTVYRKYLRRATAWKRPTDHFVVLETYRDLLKRIRLPEKQVKILFDDYMNGVGARLDGGPEDLLHAYADVIAPEIRKALAGDAYGPLDMELSGRIVPFLWNVRYARDVEAAYIHWVETGNMDLANIYMGILAHSAGDGASLDFLRRRGRSSGNSTKDYRDCLEMLRTRLVREYVRAGLEPPATLAQKLGGSR